MEENVTITKLSQFMKLAMKKHYKTLKNALLLNFDDFLMI